MNYAGFWRRFGAHIIDSIILAIPGLLVGGSIRTFTAGIGVNLVLALLYYPIFESSEMMATPGKALLGIIVQSETGERLTFKAAAVRFFTRYLSMLVIYIGYLMQVFTQKRQTLHDMLSGSVVVKQDSNPNINYFNVWKEQFKFVVSTF